MKTLIATLALVAATSANAFFGDNDSNVNGYGSHDMAGFTNGNASGTGKFSMSIHAEGSAKMDGNASGASNTGLYGQGYRTPYYGYAPYYYEAK